MALTRLPGFTLDSTSSFTFANASVTANVTAGNIKTDNLLYANGSPWSFGSSTYSNANVELYLPTYTGQMANALVAGTVYTAAQPNITSVGSLVSLTATGLITATAGGIKVGNIQDTSGTNTIQVSSGTTGIIGNLNVGTGGTGNVTATYFIGNGSQLTGLPATYSNADVANYLPTYTGNFTAGNANISGSLTAGAFTTVGSSGNISGANYITANYFVGDGSQLTGLPAGYSNSNVAAYLLTNTGNISAGYFIGNGSSLTNINSGNIDGQVSNALIAGTVYTNAQPNITSVGTLTSINVSGNATIAGNLTVGGNINYINVDTLVIEDPIIEQGGGPNGAPLTTNDGKDRGSLLHYYTTEVVDAFMGWDNSAGEFAFGSNVSISSEVVTFNTLGNVRASTFIGSLSGAATTAATVTTNAQPNITSVGTLTSLDVTGNLTAGNFITSGTGGNISGANNITANFFIGDGSQLTGLPAGYANANVANYLPTYTGNFSPSNLVVSTSANLGSVGNVIITGGTADYVLKTDGAGNLSWTAQSGGSSTTTTIAVDNFTGNGVADTYTLSVTPTSVNSVFVNYNGAFVGRGSYSLDGANLTFGSVPANGASIEVTTIEGLTIGSGAFTTRTATGDGTETDYTVTSGATESSVLVTLDGVLQTPTSDYTVSGTTLTFTAAPYNGAAIQIRELAVASSSGGTSGASRAVAMTMGIIFGG